MAACTFNIESIRKIFETKLLIDKPLNKNVLSGRKPRKKSLDKVFNAVKDNNGINRKAIIKESGKTGHCVDLCLEQLISEEKLSRELIRMSGSYKVYSYKVKE